METLIAAAAQIGSTAAIALYLVYQSTRREADNREREKSMSASYERLVERLLTVIGETNQVVRDNTNAIEDLRQIVERRSNMEGK